MRNKRGMGLYGNLAKYFHSLTGGKDLLPYITAGFLCLFYVDQIFLEVKTTWRRFCFHFCDINSLNLKSDYFLL